MSLDGPSRRIVAEPVIVVGASFNNGSQFFVYVTVTLAGSPTLHVAFGKVTCAVMPVDVSLSSPESAWLLRQLVRAAEVVGGAVHPEMLNAERSLLTTTQRAASFARCVSSIQ